MRRAETLSVNLNAPLERAWKFISNPQNLHLWTVDFALAPPKQRGDVFEVQTPRGALELFVRSDRDTGTIDFYSGREGKFRCSPSRLVPNGDGCIYIFTQFEPPDAPPGLFEKLVENVRKELQLLSDRFSNGTDQ